MLDGRKTQTRRILSFQSTLLNGKPWSKFTKAQEWDWRKAFVDPGPSPAGNPGPYLKLPWLSGDTDPFDGTTHRVYPKMQTGDRLWVKETHARVGDNGDDHMACPDLARLVYYRADDVQPELSRWRPSIFMRRQDSRITLIVTEVRVERLQEISIADALAEGVFVPEAQYAQQGEAAPRLAYACLWEEINGPGTWDANPWVAAYTFKVIKKNIDQIAKVAA
ncbi:hypothetical protein [Sinorhizobium sp. M4_45]|uniref:hypothetical protein n=1 Tax=Sinorhizobium sp. M4_45 TaxID=2037901 RepID=UPI001FE21990|nr:hypothetical protein [Sinorhizobium sp. M4_45]